jgi:hypothetical protein
MPIINFNYSGSFAVKIMLAIKEQTPKEKLPLTGNTSPIALCVWPGALCNYKSGSYNKNGRRGVCKQKLLFLTGATSSPCAHGLGERHC